MAANHNVPALAAVPVRVCRYVEKSTLFHGFVLSGTKHEAFWEKLAGHEISRCVVNLVSTVAVAAFSAA